MRNTAHNAHLQRNMCTAYIACSERRLYFILASPFLQNQVVQRTANAPNLPIADVGVKLRCPRIFVPHQFLNVPHIHTVFQQVGGKGMAQGVNGRFFTNARPVSRPPEHRLDGPWRNVAAGPAALLGLPPLPPRQITPATARSCLRQPARSTLSPPGASGVRGWS